MITEHGTRISVAHIERAIRKTSIWPGPRSTKPPTNITLRLACRNMPPTSR